MTGRAVVLQGDARRLPLPDASVDLIVTSPPYFGLRSYTDAGEAYEGQIGSEATPGEFLAALWECTAEWMRVLKPSGSMFVNLGDKYAGGGGGGIGSSDGLTGRASRPPRRAGFAPDKSLMGLPWRYALGCIDRLGLILRAEIIWAKPNGLPESVTDRVRRSHEQVFHFTKLPRYYAAIDEIREPQIRGHLQRHNVPEGPRVDGGRRLIGAQGLHDYLNPLGKLPGSVWSIPSAPLQVPAHLGVDHFAAFPPALVRPLVLGWSPPGVCTGCGEGRRPVLHRVTTGHDNHKQSRGDGARDGAQDLSPRSSKAWWAFKMAGGGDRITGYVCACAPYTDHPGTGERHRNGQHPSGGNAGANINAGTRLSDLGSAERTGPWREYHNLENWQLPGYNDPRAGAVCSDGSRAPAPPTRPAVVVDPFGGTGTTALVAAAHGRVGISIDRSADYTRLAQWRVSDPGERARALDVPKPPPVMDGQDSLFDVTGGW